MIKKILLGTYTKRKSKGVYSIELDTEKKTKLLGDIHLEAEVGSPTYLDVSKDGTFLYTVLKDGNKGGIIALKKTDDGTYATTDVYTAEGSSPCYISYDPSRNVFIHCKLSQWGNFSI